MGGQQDAQRDRKQQHPLTRRHPRDDGPSSRREQQIINLSVARHWGARYPWFAQVRGSLAAGIEQAVIDAINACAKPDLPDARERTCFIVARELLANKNLCDESYAAAEQTMGLKDLMALVASTGSFSMTCLTTNTFGIDPPPANPSPLAALRAGLLARGEHRFLSVAIFLISVLDTSLLRNL